MCALHADDSMLAGPNEAKIDQIMKEMKQAELNITVEGDIQDFLGINIERKDDGSIHLTQPHLIDQMLKDLRLDQDKPINKNLHKKALLMPASSSRKLKQHSDSKPFDNSFHCKSVM